MSSEDDIIWHDQQERIGSALAAAFPELDKLTLIKAVDDWLFCQNELTDWEYIERCFAQAYDMFITGVTMSDRPEDFAEFIQPAVKAFYHKEKPDAAAIVALIHELTRPDAQR